MVADLVSFGVLGEDDASQVTVTLIVLVAPAFKVVVPAVTPLTV